MADAFACAWFPPLEALDLPRPILENYARLTHPGHPDHAAYRADLLGIPRPVPEAVLLDAPASPATIASSPIPPTPAPTPTPRTPDPRMARHHERALLVLGCDYRGEQLQGLGGGCGCTSTWFCSRGAGTFRGNPFEVALSECLACVAKPNGGGAF